MSILPLHQVQFNKHFSLELLLRERLFCVFGQTALDRRRKKLLKRPGKPNEVKINLWDIGIIEESRNKRKLRGQRETRAIWNLWSWLLLTKNFVETRWSIRPARLVTSSCLIRFIHFSINFFKFSIRGFFVLALVLALLWAAKQDVLHNLHFSKHS